MREFAKIKRRVNGRARSPVNFVQFLQIFFLFDNNTPCDACPHGSRDRIFEATKQLHKSLESKEEAPTTPTPFTAPSQSPSVVELLGAQESSSQEVDANAFEQLFHLIDRNHDQFLSCQELEMFFYMYSARVVETQTVVVQ